ncbi:hypothetical protein ACN9MN_08910 [Chryseobacterium sp. S-02]|uniref:hypothetical protein n=1 Tax=Chryseobacterium sp. S-02 TaxID=3404064 RepID=UPI003CFB5E1E
MKIIIVLFILFLLTSCNKENNRNINSNTLEINKEWIKDSLGCLKKRNNDYSENLIQKYNLKNSNISDFKKVFGPPNTTERGNLNTDEILIYFFDSYCENNILQNNSDKCYATFYFRNNILIDRSYMCE